MTGNFLFGIHGGLGRGLGRGLGVGAASPRWASASRCGGPSTGRSGRRHTILPDAPSVVDEEALIAPEGPGALSLEVQEAVAQLGAELALLWRQVAVQIDLAAAQRLAVLQCSVLRGDTGESHQYNPGSRCRPHTARPQAPGLQDWHRRVPLRRWKEL